MCACAWLFFYYIQSIMMPANGSRFYLKSADKLYVKSSLKAVSLYNFHCSINTFDCSIFYCMVEKVASFSKVSVGIQYRENVFIVMLSRTITCISIREQQTITLEQNCQQRYNNNMKKLEQVTIHCSGVCIVFR